MTVARTVRRLHLRGPSEAAVRRTVVKLEDALRTASLPEQGGRILIVRRLVLPPIASDATSQSLALAFERALESSRREWVHGGDERAGQATAIWFADALDAHQAAARRVLRGASLQAWFWPRAISGLIVDGDARVLLRRLALSLAQVPEAAVALPLWVARVLACDGGQLLRASLAQADAVMLARAAGIRWTPSPITRHTAASGIEVNHTGVGVDGDSGKIGNFVNGSIASLLVRLAAMAGYSSPAFALQQVQYARSRLALPRTSLATASQPRLASSLAAKNKQSTALPRTDDDLPLQAVTETPSVDRKESIDRNSQPVERASDASLDRAAHYERAMNLPFGAPTTAGGLLFLLPVLQRLGYVAWLDASPRWAQFDIVRRLFTQLLQSLQIGEDDPAWALAVPTNSRPGAAPRRFIAPVRWQGLYQQPLRVLQGARHSCVHDVSGRWLLAAWQGARPHVLRDLPPASDIEDTKSLPWQASAARLDAVTSAWRTACRRWLRRQAGTGLADLVHRPALLTTSATHIDLTFDLNSIDLRLRRAGLDLDPGWLPWFGRVVSFRYEPCNASGASDGPD